MALIERKTGYGRVVIQTTTAGRSGVECPLKAKLVDQLVRAYAELESERPDADTDPQYLKRKPRKKKK